jgi:hypothetical protein
MPKRTQDAGLDKTWTPTDTTEVARPGEHPTCPRTSPKQAAVNPGRCAIVQLHGLCKIGRKRQDSQVMFNHQPLV